MGYSTPATVGTGPTPITDTMWNELVNDLIDLKTTVSAPVLNADSVTLTNGMVCSLNSSGNLLRTTSAGQAGPLVVVQEQLVSGVSTGIAAGATGFYAASGRVTVKITGTVAKGDPLQASATVGVAQTGSANPFALAVTAGSGGFCQAIVFQFLPGAGTGTVTSVAATVPAWLSVAGSPVTTSGTLAVTAATGQAANRVLASPDGTTGAVTLRPLGLADLPTVPAVRAYHSANQSLADTTWTVLALNAERFDTDTMHDLVTTNSRLTARTAGVYQITGLLEFAANATGVRFAEVLFNGGTSIAFGQGVASGSLTARVAVTCLYQMAVNDYVELRGLQSSGGALNVLASGNYSPEFMMVRVG